MTEITRELWKDMSIDQLFQQKSLLIEKYNVLSRLQKYDLLNTIDQAIEQIELLIQKKVAEK
jgi:hypothetical protein